MMGIIAAASSLNDSFEFTWQTDNAGTSNDDQATLPIIISAALDCVVTWGDADGSKTTLNSASLVSDLTHTYSAGAGTKSISISGNGINGFSFANIGDKLKILNVSNTGNLDITESETFFGCINLTWTAFRAPIITTTNLSNTFSKCPSFNGNIGKWDVSNVTDISFMFTNSASFNQPLNNWNVSNVTNMISVFNGSNSFNQPLNNWNVSSVTNMKSMFAGTSGAYAFNQDINSWDTSSVTDMSFMFDSSDSYNKIMYSWDVSSVTLMEEMFKNATSFNQDISSWNVSNVTNMSLMFQNATSFDQAINAWSISQVTNFNNFMTGVTLSTINYDLLLPAWNAQGVMSYSGTVNFGSSQYHLGGAVEAARTSLISKWGAIIDGGGIAENNEFEFTWKTDNAGTSNDDQATLPFAISADLDCVVDWGDTDGSTTTLNSASSVGDLTHTYSGGAGTKSISISGTGINSFAFANNGDKLKILEVSNVGNLDITLVRSFDGCTNLTWTAITAPTITTTDLNQTFRGCTNFNGNINNWDVSSVTTLANMFQISSSFNQPLNNWDVSSVTDISAVFNEASVFNQLLSNWNVGNVTIMSGMFFNATAFNQPLNNWNVINVESMNDAFFAASAFNQPLNNWNVSSVTNMSRMFASASSFDQDISAWDVNQNTDFIRFMSDVTLSTINYDLLLLAWDTQGAMSFSGTANFGLSKYTGGGEAAAARASLVTKWGGITDGGEV